MTTQKLVLRLNELSAKDELTDGEQGEMRELFAEYPKLEEAAARGDDADSRSERIAAQKNGPPLPRPVEIERRGRATGAALPIINDEGGAK